MDSNLPGADANAHLAMQGPMAYSSLNYIHEDLSWLDGFFSLDSSGVSALDAPPSLQFGEGSQELECYAMEVDSAPPSGPKTARNPRFHYPTEVWEGRKEEIRHLYIEKDLSLPKVMQIMASRGLVGTEKMFKSRFTQWGFVKANRRRDIAHLLQLKARRDACGKKTVFMRNGRIIDIDRYLRRTKAPVISPEGVESLSDLQNLPRYLSARTPSPPPRQILPPESLRFDESILRQIHQLAAQSYDGWDYHKISPCTGVHGDPIFMVEEGFTLLRSRNVAEGQKLLQLGFHFLPNILLGPYPLYTLLSVLVVFAENWDFHAILAEFWRFLAAYSDLVLRGAHPLHGIIQEIYQLYKTRKPDTATEQMSQIFLRVVSLLRACPSTPDPELLIWLMWQKHRSDFGEPGEPIAMDLLNDIARARNLIKEKFGSSDPYYAMAMRCQLTAISQFRGRKSLEAFQCATDSLKEFSELYPDHSRDISDCKLYIAIYHREKWLESSTPACLDPRHELARHYLQENISFMRSTFWLSTDASVYLDHISMLSEWEEEAGLLEEARKTRILGDAVWKKIASLPEPESAGVDIHQYLKGEGTDT